MKNYQTEELAAQIPLPESVNVAMADIATTMREGLLAVAVTAGLAVMGSLMEESVTALCGPKGKHNPGRSAVRHGAKDRSVTLGGRHVGVRRPRVRTTDGSGEVSVPAYELFSSTELRGEGNGQDDGQAVHSPLPGRPRARRYEARGRGPLDVEVGRVPPFRRGHRDGLG